MSWLDNIAASLKDVVTTVSEKAQQFQNQSFADACMANCALFSMADGVLQPEERSKVVGCIQNIRDLHCFKATDLRDSFDAFCRQSADSFGRVEVIKAIRKVKGDPDQADMVVKIGLIIAKSKGDLAEVEKAVAREVIHELGLNESDYDLSSRAAAPAPAVAQAQAPSAPPPATPARKPRVQGTSLKDAKPGERVSFKQIAGVAPSRIVAGFGWDASPNVSLTASALIFDKEKKLIQKVAIGAATAGGVVHNGNVSTVSAVGDDEEIALNLAGLPTEAASIIFVIRSANGQSAQGTKSAYVRVSDPDKQAQLIRFDFAASPTMVALVVGRVYVNNGEWKFAAIGDSVANGDADKQIASFA